MQVAGGRVLISPSDIASAAACEFAWLRRLDVGLGRAAELPDDSDPLAERAAELGVVHEERQLAQYIAEYGAAGVASIPSPGGKPDAWTTAIERTASALRAATPVVFQGAVRDGDLRGLADFLVLNEGGEYVVQDTKLGRSAKVTAIIQIAAYADILARQRVPVARQGVLILGNGKRSVHDLSTAVPVYRARRHALSRLIERHLASSSPVTWGDFGISACGRCAICTEEVERTRDLLLVAGLRTTQRERLMQAGITTIDALATSDDAGTGMSGRMVSRLRRQAQLQLQREIDEDLPYEVVDQQPLAAIPPPSDGDIFFDFEGDPMWQDPDDQTWGLEYLFGVVEADTGDFVSFWADDRKQEKAALRDFLKYVAQRRAEWPDMHIYHYASYERSTLLRLAGHFGVGEDEIDDLLRAGALVDLYPIVRGALQVGSRSYGLKALEPLFLEGARAGEVTTAGDSVMEYRAYCLDVERGDFAAADQIKQEILAYNKQDCASTRLLRDWLLDHTEESGTPERPSPEPEEGGSAVEESVYTEPLLAMAGEKGTPAEQGYALLAAAVGYHRREKKPFWWGHFDRLENPPDAWADAADALLIEECTLVADWDKPGRGNHKRVLRVRGRLQPGSCLERTTDIHLLYDCPHPDGMKDGGEATRGYTNAQLEIVSQEDDIAVAELIETLPSKCQPFPDLPMAAAPTMGPNSKPLQDSIRALASGTIGTQRLPDPVANLLLRQAPHTTAPLPPVLDDDYVSAITTAARSLVGSTLAVQGPPGTGKTYTAAHVIADLVAGGWRVGVTSQGHSAVNHLLDCIVAAGVNPSQVGKKEKPKESAWTHVPTNRAAEFLATHQESGCVLGGTAWDFANANRVQDGELDLLVIDEAGQFCLADTIAVSRSAQRMLLLGDPQQLPQVSQGTHPEPVDDSALGWLTQGEILPAEFGYFLATTRRMHPALCEAVSRHSYAGRLTAHSCTLHRALLDASGTTVDPGVVVDYVEHAGNSVASEEEAKRICDLARTALTWKWQETDGTTPRSVTPADVLIVAPYNAQVDLIRCELESQSLSGFRAGTVDKFQGQEAPIVLVSMTASSHEDVPRGMEFLLSPNRVNVALSRAQWRTTIVCSSRLTDYLPSRPERLDELGRFMRLAMEQTMGTSAFNGAAGVS